MKKILISISALTLCLLLSFKTNDQKEKTYTVVNTLGYWQSKVNLIEYAKQAIKGSDLPAKVALPLSDSLSKFESELIDQIKPQIDTTHKK